MPAAAVEHIVGYAPEIVTASGFEIAPQTLTPSLRIEITRARALRFSPVLLGSAGVVHDRALLPQFGKYFLVGNRFASPARRAADVRRARGERTGRALRSAPQRGTAVRPRERDRRG